MASQWIRLRSYNSIHRPSLRASSTGLEDVATSWLHSVGILGVAASAAVVMNESASSDEHSNNHQSTEEQIKLVKDNPISTCSSQLTPNSHFLAPKPKIVCPFQPPPITHCEGFSFFGRKSSLKRNKTVLAYKREVSQETVRSRYKVNWKKPLGEGGFGAVYSATDRRTGEKVALKQISKKYTDNVGFQREMQAFLHLRRAGGHPNICGLRENFDEGNYFYFSLDLISGGEMFDHLIRSGPYSEQDASRLVREVASALDFMHGIGFVHG
jgi:Protein kinase domain